jgi:hypothetical protein
VTAHLLISRPLSSYAKETCGTSACRTNQGISARVRIPEQTLAATENVASVITIPRQDSSKEGPGSWRVSVVERRMGASGA